MSINIQSAAPTKQVIGGMSSRECLAFKTGSTSLVVAVLTQTDS